MLMMVVMFMAVPMTALVAPSAPKHPGGNADDEHGRGHLEIRLRGLGVPVAAEVEAGERDQPDDGGVGQRCRQPQQNGLRQRAADGHDEGGHHRLRMTGLQAMKSAKQDGAGHEEPGVALLQKRCEVGHEMRLLMRVVGTPPQYL